MSAIRSADRIDSTADEAEIEAVRPLVAYEATTAAASTATVLETLLAASMTAVALICA
jgi:hypothetical protein